MPPPRTGRVHRMPTRGLPCDGVPECPFGRDDCLFGRRGWCTMPRMKQARIPSSPRPDRHGASAQRAAPRGAPRAALASTAYGIVGPPVAADSSWRDLQELAGNRAVTWLVATTLQRQPVDEAAALGEGLAPPDAATGPLDEAGVKGAIRYYTSQPWRYTPAIISQLRSALGLGDGGVDAALVQAVATWQQTNGANDPALAVDGKAGPRTLPRIFRGGLNAPGEGQAFGEAVQGGVIDSWATLATPEARLKKLVELVNVPLAAHGVPPVTDAFDADVNNSGSFDFATWRMLVGKTPLSAGSLDTAAAKDLTDTIYHEARHTEQWFRMAQLRAGQGLSAGAITAELGIPANIATLAKASPLNAKSMQGLIAQGWWDSVYGAGSAHREATLAELGNASTALRKARAAFTKNPTPENQAALAKAKVRRDKVFAAYRNLPEENDAWATGPEAAAGVTQGTAPSPGPAGGAATPASTTSGLVESPGAGSSGVTGTSAPESEAAPEQVEESAGPAPEAGEEATDTIGGAAEEAPAVETEQTAGGPPAAGTPSHEILPEDNLP